MKKVLILAVASVVAIELSCEPAKEPIGAEPSTMPAPAGSAPSQGRAIRWKVQVIQSETDIAGVTVDKTGSVTKLPSKLEKWTCSQQFESKTYDFRLRDTLRVECTDTQKSVVSSWISCTHQSELQSEDGNLEIQEPDGKGGTRHAIIATTCRNFSSDQREE